ncbi:MAG: hypothetical protein JWQ38_3388 [Flavipsychrobacter sp.]|nr:hypothetical protein [Flavipsychrobacter sp.]
MGIELELCVLLLLQLLGSAFFSHFEGETPAVKKILKWLILDGITLGLYYFTGHYALLFPVALIAIGATFHIRWCKKNGIDPIKATPRKKYYAEKLEMGRVRQSGLLAHTVMVPHHLAYLRYGSGVLLICERRLSYEYSYRYVAAIWHLHNAYIVECSSYIGSVAAGGACLVANDGVSREQATQAVFTIGCFYHCIP